MGAVGRNSKQKAAWPPDIDGSKATFAAGCFWGPQVAFERVPGVLDTCVGYCGGSVTDPSYEDVCTGKTGHAESVQVIYDPQQVSFRHLLEVFHQHHDPTQLNKQGNDIGPEYRSAIFYHDDEQLRQAEEWKNSTPGAVTEIAAENNNFWPAEEYHQHFLARGGNFGRPQSEEKGCTDQIRCYG